jgi:asparagine synthase (glutamine-hydrolysing)
MVKGFLRVGLSAVLGFCPRFEFERVRELLGFERLDDIHLYERLVEKIDRPDLERLLKRKVDFTDSTGLVATKTGLSAVQHHDIIHYLEGDILTKVDRAAMAVSLETRPPFLDHKLMELCFSMSDSLKLRGGEGKSVLKRAFRGILPDEIIKRKKKGFGVPIKYYLKNELYDMVRKYVFEYDKHDYFDRGFLMSMSKGSKPRDTTRLYWNIMMFNMWHERWICQS